MKNRTLNPAYAFVLCYAAMVCLAIAVNLMPIFLTTLRVDLGGRTGLTGEQLGRISALTFAGLVAGILFTGPLADRWRGRLFIILGTLLIGVGLALLGIALAFSAAMALGRIFAGLIGRRVDSIRLMLGCCWTSVVLFLLACFAPWPAVALASSVAVGLAGSCLWPTTLGVAADRFPQGGTTMFGVLAAFGNLGGILMPWLVGVTSDWSSLRLGLATSTACPLLMAFVLLWMRRRPAAEFSENHDSIAQAV